MIKTAFAVLATSLAIGAASAQAADFSGFYVGADVGGETLQYDVPHSDLSGHGDGFTYGGFGGYRLYLGSKWLVGVEGRFGKTNSDIFANGVTFSSKRELSASALVGYQLADKWLVLGTLGYDRLRIRASDGIISRKDSLDGLGLTFGVEYALSDTLSIRGSVAESSYQRSGFDGSTFNDPALSRTSIAAIFRY